MWFSVRYFGFLRISGMMSLRTIDSGAFQYGLTMISLIFELRIGVWRSILPTMAVWREHDAVVLDRLDLGGRHVDHDIALAEEAGHGAQAHQIGLELAEAHRRPRRSSP